MKVRLCPHSSFTGRVGAVSSAAEVVLQELVGPGGAGSSHEPHCGLMEKHLQRQKQQESPSTEALQAR